MPKFIAALKPGSSSNEVITEINSISSEIVIIDIHERPHSQRMGALILFECTEEVFQVIKKENIPGIKYLEPEITHKIPDTTPTIRRD